jgi:hypothetical protein
VALKAPRGTASIAISLQQAIDDLYQVAVVRGAAQSPARLKALAEYCVQELARRGLPDAGAEQKLPGGGREKSWDVAWGYDRKYRLAISLKSLLKNLPGTVPNRIDDLMGEAANIQLYSPEIVTGYIMIFDVGADAHSVKHNSTWANLLRGRLATLSGRRSPAWSIGTVEAAVMLEVDFEKSSAVLAGAELMGPFFDVLVEQVKQRNPGTAFTLPSSPQEVDNG